MENQFKTSIVAHIQKLEAYYKKESNKWKVLMDENPRLKGPREEYLKSHWEYRAYNTLLTNIYAGNYDSESYYNNYLNPKTK